MRSRTPSARAAVAGIAVCKVLAVPAASVVISTGGAGAVGATAGSARSIGGSMLTGRARRGPTGPGAPAGEGRGGARGVGPPT